MVLLGTARGPWKGVQRSVVEICKVLPNYSNLNGLFSMNSMFLDKINVLELNCKFLLAVRAMLVEN